MVDPTVIALASLMVAAIAALASPITSWLVARSDQDHERAVGAIDRRQRRLELAYKRTVLYLLKARDQIARTEPMLSWTNVPGPPTPLEEAELRDIEADVAMHGSPMVLAKMNELVGLERAFYADVGSYLALKRGSGPDKAQGIADAGMKMEASRTAARDAITAIIALINDELREE